MTSELTLASSHLDQISSVFSNGMTAFQMEFFVVHDSITPYRKVRQAMIELRSRKENLEMIKLDREELSCKEEKANLDLARYQDPMDAETSVLYRGDLVRARRAKIEISRKDALIEQITSEIAHFEAYLHAALLEIAPTVDAAVERLKDPAFQQQEERNFWKIKLTRSALSDFINFGTLSKGMVESLSCLPEDLFKEILAEAVFQKVGFTHKVAALTDQTLIKQD